MKARSLSVYATFGVLSAGALPVTAAMRGVALRDVTHRRAGRSLRTLGRTIVRATRVWDFSVLGSPPADLDERPCVVVANHASLADPFLLSYLPFDQRFVAKEELFRVPLVGWLLRLAGDIPIRRGDHASAVSMESECVATLRNGLSVTIFPEGTRTKDGTLGRFRDGAFRVARAADVRILPVVLRGTGDCIVGNVPSAARASAEILPAIETRGLTVAEARDATRAAFERALGVAAPPAPAPVLAESPRPAPQYVEHA